MKYMKRYVYVVSGINKHMLIKLRRMDIKVIGMQISTFLYLLLDFNNSDFHLLARINLRKFIGSLNFRIKLFSQSILCLLKSKHTRFLKMWKRHMGLSEENTLKVDTVCKHFLSWN